MTNFRFIIFILYILLLSQTVFSENDIFSTDVVLDSSYLSSDSVSINDSVYELKLRDKYLKLNNLNRRKYQIYPKNVDSLYNPAIVYPFHIFQTDGIDLFEIMSNNVSFVSIPFSLSSNLNKFLFYGYPGSPLTFRPERSMFDYFGSQVEGINTFSITEIKNIQFESPLDISFSIQPFQLAKPETNIFIELGPFKQNFASIRFSRPIGDNIQLGIFSNYKYLNRQDYSHRRGGIYSGYKAFYKNLGLDTSLVLKNGTNPLTKEHITSARMTWKAGNGSETSISYKYSDLHNDISSEYSEDTLRDSLYLIWEECSQYRHTIQFRLFSFPLNKNFHIHSEALLKSSKHGMSPISKIIKEKSRLKGERFLSGGAIQSDYIFNGNNKIVFQFSVDRNKIQRYNSSNWVIHKTKSLLKYHNSTLINSFGISIDGSAGPVFVKLNGKLEQLFTGSLSLSNSIANQKFSVYFKHDIMPPVIPLDTSSFILPGGFIDDFQLFGTEAYLLFKKFGLLIGSSFVNDIKKSTIRNYWPKGILPYKQPGWVFNVTPTFGKWYGLSFMSQWLFSDKKPYIKSKNNISYHFNRPGKTFHLFLDAGMNYWSKRDEFVYAGIDTWNKASINFNFKTSVHIKTFRLFYKIDNIFNRKIAYLPGYFMPGLVFRYGFNWIIQG